MIMGFDLVYGICYGIFNLNLQIDILAKLNYSLQLMFTVRCTADPHLAPA